MLLLRELRCIGCVLLKVSMSWINFFFWMEAEVYVWAACSEQCSQAAWTATSITGTLLLEGF